ncbi:HIT domain-containing protein [Spirillospora sp. NPDC047279]|uniref:HIT family protein n=1 Tax=Spirillospora sp. NPDC047279 TaxID=3155478 RepID=UPI0033EAF4EB
MRTDVVADCVLCPPLRFRFNAMVDLPGEAAVLAADEHFFLMPDLAPIVDGHLLLVTVRHHECAGAFDPAMWARARAWRDRVARAYRAAYGSDDLVLLEHGPGTAQGGGSCIDHAHWHLLPGSGGVRAVVTARGLPGEPASHETVRRRYRRRRSYLLIEECGTATVHPGDGVPSQFLRWAATVALAEGPWRWQETFGLPGSRARFLRTVRALQPRERADSHQ